GDCGPVQLSTTNPANGSAKQVSTPVVYNGQHLAINLVFLARGNVQGTVTSAGNPMPGAFVTVTPSLDAIGSITVLADGAGHYTVPNSPVGDVSVFAVGAGAASNATGFAAGTVPGPGQTATINVSLQNITGVVKGRVVNPDQASTPSAGSLVVATAALPG